MATLLQRLQQIRLGRAKKDAQAIQKPGTVTRSQKTAASFFDIAPYDPLTAYFLSAPGAVEIDKLRMDSPALKALQAAGVKMAVPLVSQGELVGLLNLGPRLSEQDYSTDDRSLLNDLSTQAAPALRVAQLVREKRIQEIERERIEQELRVARLIQQTLLPKEIPELPGWQISSYYQPAREVGGDFYDFLYFEDGRMGIVIGDVTIKVYQPLWSWLQRAAFCALPLMLPSLREKCWNRPMTCCIPIFRPKCLLPACMPSLIRSVGT